MKKIRYLIYGTVGFFLAGCLFLLFVFFQLSMEKISGHNIKTEIQRLKEKEVEFVKLKQDYRDWQRVDEIYDRFTRDYLYAFDDFFSFKTDFESLLRTAFSRVPAFQYDIKNIDRNIVMVAIEFQVQAGYRNIKEFIYEIEKRTRMVFLKKMELGKVNNQVESKLILEAYFAR